MATVIITNTICYPECGLRNTGEFLPHPNLIYLEDKACVGQKVPSGGLTKLAGFKMAARMRSDNL